MSLITELPNFIPTEHWHAYLAMRKEIKKPATAFAQKLLFKKLLKMLNDGEDLEKVLEGSIVNNWTDVYPVRKDSVSKGVITTRNAAIDWLEESNARH